MHRSRLAASVVVSALGLIALPAPAHAQAAKVHRVGWVAMGPETPSAREFLDAFREGMRERGWVEGRNLAIEPRWGARAASGTTPIVFGFSGDPVEAGLINSLTRPGGNLTGVTFLAYQLVHKRLELLKEALPGVTRVAVLANVSHPGEQAELRESRDAARRLGLVLQYVPVRSPGDFPAEQASKFELVVNLSAAKALGVTLPSSVLVRADRVID